MSYQMHTEPTGLPMLLESVERLTIPLMGEFDWVIGTGQSGIVAGTLLAHKYNKKLVVVRKQGERAHGGEISAHYTFFRDLPANLARSILLDDLVETGATVHRVLDAFEGRRPKYAVMYSDYPAPLGALDSIPLLRINPTYERGAVYTFGALRGTYTRIEENPYGAV